MCLNNWTVDIKSFMKKNSKNKNNPPKNPVTMGRRKAIKAGIALAAATSIPTLQHAQAHPETDSSIKGRPTPNATKVVTGEVFGSPLDSNPLEAKVVTFTIVSSDVDASVVFYRDVIGMTVQSDTVLKNTTTLQGMGLAGHRHVLLSMPNSGWINSQVVRILEAPPGAGPIRPRPESGPNDPGLYVLEGGTRDPAESYHALVTANTPVISPPRYYYFRNTMWGMDVDSMSYSPFGPGGEQMFITASIRSDQKIVRSIGLHNGFGSASITTLDQRPVNSFFKKAFGIKRTSQMECYQENVNELIGAPTGTYFLWGNLGLDVGIEVWEMKAKSGTIYPCSLDKTGLAMLTLRVNDLDKCRTMCAKASIEIVSEGALPNLLDDKPAGFILRGAVGELFEVVQA